MAQAASVASSAAAGMATSAPSSNSLAHSTAPAHHSGVHLVILHNGLWGNPGHLSWLADRVVEAGARHAPGAEENDNGSSSNSPQPAVELLNCEKNRWIRTYDGIDDCGGRVARDVLERIQNPDAPPVTLISFVGYSLGGVILRYAIGVLWAHGYLRGGPDNDVPDTQAGPSARSIRPGTPRRRAAPRAFHFCTFATPHLGGFRDTGAALFDHRMNAIGSGLTGRTGAQMTARDAHRLFYTAAATTTDTDAQPRRSNYRHALTREAAERPDLWLGGRPLLEILADPNLPFWKGLSVFLVRSAYGNVRSDPLVPLPTACILPSHPYLDRVCELRAQRDGTPQATLPVQSKEAGELLWDESLYKVVDHDYPSLVELNSQFSLPEPPSGTSTASIASKSTRGAQDSSPSDPGASNAAAVEDEAETVKDSAPTLIGRIVQAVLPPTFLTLGIVTLSGMWVLWRVSRTSIQAASLAIKKKDFEHASTWTLNTEASSIYTDSTDNVVADPKDSPLATATATDESPYPSSTVKGLEGTGLSWIESWAVRHVSLPPADTLAAQPVFASAPQYACWGLSQLEWRRRHVRSQHRRSHATIVRRAPQFSGNEDVASHWLDSLFAGPLPDGEAWE
ncbi:hypothetical protein HK405_000434 [Cladochytrium tenue]|nr:hypothetical protein HK405_000434 [Cladochytrium tenue]